MEAELSVSSSHLCRQPLPVGKTGGNQGIRWVVCVVCHYYLEWLVYRPPGMKMRWWLGALSHVNPSWNLLPLSFSDSRKINVSYFKSSCARSIVCIIKKELVYKTLFGIQIFYDLLRNFSPATWLFWQGITYKDLLGLCWFGWNVDTLYYSLI